MAIHSPPHQQPFIPDQVQTDRSNFHCFPLLPKELRQQIWESALQRSRIIHLHLKDPSIVPAPMTDAAEMSRLASNGERFWATADGHQTLSKMFRVNREAREAALSFYRVRFPCWLRTVAGGMKPGILYFNPEHDFLRITPEWSVKNTLFNFLRLLKTTYDPRHIGLRNLVVSGNDLRANDLELIEPSDPDLDRGPKESFKGLLENLDEVFFFSTTHAGRQILGTHNGVPTSEIVYNRSFPIQVNLPTFDRLPRDPRHIGEDLKQVYIGMNDHRDTIRLWHRRLDQFGITAPGIKYKWYIAFEPREDERISDVETARKFLQQEDDLWNGVKHSEHPPFVQMSDYKFPVGAQSERYKNEDLETAVKPAFGFWLFPIDVLGSLEETGGPDTPLWDFSKNCPELGVVSLPERAQTG
jgi:hypothetical protein